MRALVVASATSVAMVSGLLPVAAAPSFTESLTKASLALSASDIDERSQGTRERSRPRPKVTKHEWHGFLSCSARNPGVPSFNMHCGSWDPNHESQHMLQADRGLKTIVVAMVWEPSDLSLDPYLQHDIFVNLENEEVTGQNYAFRDDAALPGLEYRLDANPKNPMLDWDNATGPIPIEFRIGAGTAGDANVVIQQPFTVHYHLFYGKRAPKKYSALP